MIHRASSNSAQELPVCDVCVIGAGAMGIALAIELGRRGKKVVVVEAGGEEITQGSQDYYKCQSVGHQHTGSSEGRFRVFGGSTERWGGQAMRFDDIDFEPRAGIFAEGWPVRLAQLEPYYKKAESFMGIRGPDYGAFAGDVNHGAELFRCGGPPPAGLPESLQLHYSIFTTKPRLRETYKRELAGNSNIFVLLEAPARTLLEDNNGQVTGVVVETPEGGAKTVRAREYVLACGCLENARFLLIQRDVFHSAGLKALPQLGQCLQDHPGAHLGEVEFTPAGAFLQHAFRLRKRNGAHYKGRLSWSAEHRRKYPLLAVSGTFLLMRHPSPDDDVVSISGPGFSLRPVAQAARLVAKCLVKGRFYSPLHRTVLAVSAEDIRAENSRVTLSGTATDAQGFPRAVVDWKVSSLVAESILVYIREFTHYIENNGFGIFRRFAFTRDIEGILAKLKDNSHHIGATSMALDRSRGVVDKNLKVFGYQNLSITGTSVLPTGSHANPTLTALALNFRLADRLCALEI